MKVLFDSDVLFALYVASDNLHLMAKNIFQKLLDKEMQLFTSNLVLQETATVISYKIGQNQAKDFIKSFNKINIKLMFINEKISLKTWELFNKQKNNRISYIDCSNIVLCKEAKIDWLFSFDKFYTKQGLKVLIS